jgi:hypothetical protein
VQWPRGSGRNRCGQDGGDHSEDPVVELHGGEITRIISGLAEDKLTLPHLETDQKYYDWGIEYRHKTRVTAADAIRQ